MSVREDLLYGSVEEERYESVLQGIVAHAL